MVASAVVCTAAVLLAAAALVAAEGGQYHYFRTVDLPKSAFRRCRPLRCWCSSSFLVQFGRKQALTTSRASTWVASFHVS